MSILDKLSPLERAQVQKAMDQIRADLEKAVPIGTLIDDNTREQLANAVVESVSKMAPQLYVTVNPSDDPNILDVTFHGYVPHALNIPS